MIQDCECAYNDTHLDAMPCCAHYIFKTQIQMTSYETSPVCLSNFAYFHEVMMYSSKPDKPNSHNFHQVVAFMAMTSSSGRSTSWELKLHPMPYTKLKSQNVTYKTTDSWTKLDNVNAQRKSVGSVIAGVNWGPV
jgi:hypothetical protein